MISMFTRRFRFRLRTLMLVTLLVALAAWSAPLLHFWYTSVPIEQMVAEFNQTTMNNGSFKLEAKLTEYEVISALETMSGAKTTPPEQRQLYARILSTGRIPKHARFVAWFSQISFPDSSITVDLEFTSNHFATTVPIREAPPFDFTIPSDFSLPYMDDPHRLNEATWAW
jgi:hypothetical protein